MFFECNRLKDFYKFVLLIQKQKTMIYKIDNKLKSIKLFGDEFVKNNKNKCYLLIDGKKTYLCPDLILNKNQKEKEILEIRLKETQQITNFNRMFKGCTSLISLPSIRYWDINNVTDMSYMFDDCESLKELNNIDEWDVKKVTKMYNMFRNTNLGYFGFQEKGEIIKLNHIKVLYDIEKNEHNKTLRIFGYDFVKNNRDKCKIIINGTIIKLYDTLDMSYYPKFGTILKVKLVETEKITDMRDMFNYCISLISIPDISEWDMKYVTK